MLKKRLSYRNSEMANSTRTASSAKGLVKGLGVNTMRTFSASALGETLPLMNLHFKPISKAKDGRKFSADKMIFFSCLFIQIFHFK